MRSDIICRLVVPNLIYLDHSQGIPLGIHTRKNRACYSYI